MYLVLHSLDQQKIGKIQEQINWYKDYIAQTLLKNEIQELLSLYLQF